MNESEQTELLSLANHECELSETDRIHRVEQLYRKARVFEQANRLIDKHEQRALEVIGSLESEPLQRMLLYLVDTVLQRHEPTASALVTMTPVGSLPIVASN